jgi:hypothetical protein
MTTSARVSSIGGTSRPSALAVLRLMTSSYLVEPSESSLGDDHLGQAPIEEADIGFKSCQSAFAEPPEHGIFEMGGLVIDGDMLVTQLSPPG